MSKKHKTKQSAVATGVQRATLPPPVINPPPTVRPSQVHEEHVEAISADAEWSEQDEAVFQAEGNIEDQEIIPETTTAETSVSMADAYKAAMERVKELENKYNALISGKERPVYCKVSEKGAVSLYGIGRFPVTLYAEQWEKLFGNLQSVRDFIATNPAGMKRLERGNKG
jgi:hypothetical protein